MRKSLLFLPCARFAAAATFAAPLARYALFLDAGNQLISIKKALGQASRVTMEYYFAGTHWCDQDRHRNQAAM